MLDLAAYTLICLAYGTEHRRSRVYYAYIIVLAMKVAKAMILPPTEVPSAALGMFI